MQLKRRAKSALSLQSKTAGSSRCGFNSNITSTFISLAAAVMHLLEVKNLKTHFPTRAGIVRAVDDVSFHIDRGELLGLVGESGCGKSMTALSIMRLIAPPGKIVGGEMLFNDRDLMKLSNAEMRAIRGDDIAMIFQRSEEHTSELQSQSNLVCRLLLEKKKNIMLHTLV